MYCYVSPSHRFENKLPPWLRRRYKKIKLEISRTRNRTIMASVLLICLVLLIGVVTSLWIAFLLIIPAVFLIRKMFKNYKAEQKFVKYVFETWFTNTPSTIDYISTLEGWEAIVLPFPNRDNWEEMQEKYIESTKFYLLKPLHIDRSRVYLKFKGRHPSEYELYQLQCKVNIYVRDLHADP